VNVNLTIKPPTVVVEEESEYKHSARGSSAIIKEISNNSQYMIPNQTGNLTLYN
jgi:hypothetical protein